MCMSFATAVMGGDRQLSIFAALLVLATGLVVICIPEVDGLAVTLPSATGWKDEEMRLPCNLKEIPYAVFWVKENISSPQQLIPIATFFDGRYESNEERFDMNETFTLVINKLKVADEGRYHCQWVLANFKDFSNSTLLTVNAMATEHIIEQCVGEVHDSNLCTIQTTMEAPTFHLECRVTGFKPNVSLVWSVMGRALPPEQSTQHILPDGTYERREIISVTAKSGKHQNFNCTASGVSVDGASSKVITVLRLKEHKGPDAIVIAVGLTLLFILLVTIMFLVTGKLLQKYKPELLPEGLAKISCWKKPEKKPDPLTMLVEERVQNREKLRAKICEYRPGSAASNMENYLKKLDRVNINLFGQLSAGKSAFINSLFFAFKGTYEHMAAEGSNESPGDKTKQRVHYPLTPFITLQDNRGMRSFDEDELKRVTDEILAVRGVNTTLRVQADQAEQCHCAVLVYHHTYMGDKEAFPFIHQFFEQVNSIHVSSPLLVITHKNDCPESVVKDVESFVSDGDQIFLLENYTRDEHKEDVEKDIELLEFLWKTLKSCDRNAYNLAIKRKEKPIQSDQSNRSTPCIII